ncbi:succinylglutamate desuccinylase/aspartoacylase family protein [Bacteroidota bacterium]
MKRNRREFLKVSGVAGISLASAGILKANSLAMGSRQRKNKVIMDKALATLQDGSVLATSYWRIESGREGPSFLLIAAQHGNEVQGVEVARRLMEICAVQLVNGTVWIIPMAELRGIRARKYTIESLPDKLVQDKAFHRAWPGDPEGNDTERIAYALDQSVVRHCSHAVDMHCWNHFWAAETLSITNHEPSHAMGEVTTTRFISYREGSVPDRETKLMFGPLMYNRGAAYTVMELSGQYQMQERQVRIGLSSMVNIVKMLGMIEGEPELIDGPRAVRSRENNHEVKTPHSGIFMPALRKDKSAMLIPDDYVEKGQLLGHVIRDTNLETVLISAPVSGYLRQFGSRHPGSDTFLSAQHPFVEEGENVAQITTV